MRSLSSPSACVKGDHLAAAALAGERNSRPSSRGTSPPHRNAQRGESRAAEQCVPASSRTVLSGVSPQPAID